MIKKADVKKRAKECIKKSLNSKNIDKMIDKMIASGVIDLEDYDDNWVLPKNMVCAMAMQLNCDWGPITAKDKKEVKQLYAVI